MRKKDELRRSNWDRNQERHPEDKETSCNEHWHSYSEKIRMWSQQLRQDSVKERWTLVMAPREGRSERQRDRIGWQKETKVLHTNRWSCRLIIEWLSAGFESKSGTNEYESAAKKDSCRLIKHREVVESFMSHVHARPCPFHGLKRGCSFSENNFWHLWYARPKTYTLQAYDIRLSWIVIFTRWSFYYR
jgi:hypothetical protein